jgi:hypothetical protein
MERFNLKKLNELEGEDQYHVEVSNRLQLQKLWMLQWILIVLGKQLREKI